MSYISYHSCRLVDPLAAIKNKNKAPAAILTLYQTPFCRFTASQSCEAFLGLIAPLLELQDNATESGAHHQVALLSAEFSNHPPPKRQNGKGTYSFSKKN